MDRIFLVLLAVANGEIYNTDDVIEGFVINDFQPIGGLTDADFFRLTEEIGNTNSKYFFRRRFL